MQKYCLKLFAFLICYSSCHFLEAREYPHIITNNGNKETILQKIEQQDWAKAIYRKTVHEIEPYVERHQTDPEWILSRYLMNRIEGRYYTRFISDREGTRLTAYEGNAPYPTVRVSPHKRGPVTPQGGSYRMPDIEELTPYDTSMTMMLLNTDTKTFEQVDPQALVGRINGRFNDMAYKAGVIYWLTGDERYAGFAADLLDQWVKGAFYQQPIEGPGRTGFLDIQTLGDEASKPMILAYDFVEPYMKANGYDLSFYEPVFEKIAQTLAFRGYAGNNWYAAESATMVAAALALQDAGKRDYYLQFHLSRDTVNNGIGQLALPSTVKIWLTDDGHWREPGGYHNYPVLKLLESALFLENNGYEVFNRFPQLFKSSYAMVRYSFPDLTAAAFGDTGRAKQSMDCLEIGLLMAGKYKMPVFDEILSVIKLFQENGYDRSKNDITALICYMPEIAAKKVSPFRWERSETLDFAHAYYQRNGMDAENGLMYVVQGASYNHNHANGMAMELYGKGAVTGADPGNGPNYDHPMHTDYYAVWAAHNTVVAAGRSSSVPRVREGGGTKRIGRIELVAMEPEPKAKAASANFSYTDTKYYEMSTQTHQQRTMAIIRTSDSTGYYLDIYRSDNDISNDYLYHNEGDELLLLDEEEAPLSTSPASYPAVEEDIPGLRFLKNAKTAGLCKKPVIARFISAQSNGGARIMDVRMPASGNKYYYTARAPETKTVAAPYNRLPTPVLTIRTEGDVNAWKDPFIAAYEPYRNTRKGEIKSISRKLFDDGNRVVVHVKRKQGEETVMHATGHNRDFRLDNLTFTGDFGIFSSKNDREYSFYTGRGRVIGNTNYTLKAVGDSDIAASLSVNEGIIAVYVSAPAGLSIDDPSVYNIMYTAEDGKEVQVKRPAKGRFEIMLPAGEHRLICKQDASGDRLTAYSGFPNRSGTELRVKFASRTVREQNYG
ncbi:MAG: heparinase II/III family protein [Tannerella sp.]|jgi:hypothetical protein|nr:heparinase II/III family protein [Tannerella sp.]